MRKIAILILIVFALTACTQGQQDLQSKIIEANSNIDTYRNEMVMEVSGNSGGMDIEYTVEANTSVDSSAREIHMKGVMKTDVMGMKIDMPLESFILSEYLYTKVPMGMMGGSEWVKLQLPENMWEEQEQLSEQIEAFEKGGIELLPEEMLDGEEHYVASVNLEGEALRELLSEQELPQDDINYTDSIKNYSQKMWFDKDTYFLKKTIMTYTLEFESEGEAITLKSTIEQNMHDINGDVKIELPEKALNAELMEGGEKLAPSMGGVTGDVVGQLK